MTRLTTSDTAKTGTADQQSKSCSLLREGVNTPQRYVRWLAALMADVAAGHLTPREARRFRRQIGRQRNR